MTAYAFGTLFCPFSFNVYLSVVLWKIASKFKRSIDFELVLTVNTLDTTVCSCNLWNQWTSFDSLTIKVGVYFCATHCNEQLAWDLYNLIASSGLAT